MPSPEVFHSDFLKTAAPLRRRRDYGSEPVSIPKLMEDPKVESLYHLQTSLRQARESLRRAGVYSFDTPWNEKLRLCYDAIDEILDAVADAIPHQNISGQTASKSAAETPWDKPMKDKPLMAYRKYRCENCGHEQDIRTNHTGM